MKRLTGMDQARQEEQQTAAMRAVSVVVPTFREASNISRLIDRLASVRAAMGARLELIIVDDSSDDGTVEAARQAWQFVAQ